MRGHLRNLGVETETIIQGSLIETLKVPDRNFEEMKVVAHRLPARRSFGDAIRGPRGLQNYYEVHYIVRGFPFMSAESQGDGTSNSSSGWTPSPLLTFALTPLVALVLGILGADLGAITLAVVAVLGLATTLLIWRRLVDKHWRATSKGEGTDVTWKGGAIAGVLNQETRLKTAMPTGEQKKVIIAPKRGQGLVEIRTGIFSSIQEAIPSIEVFDAYDVMAGHLRDLKRGRV